MFDELFDWDYNEYTDTVYGCFEVTEEDGEEIRRMLCGDEETKKEHNT